MFVFINIGSNKGDRKLNLSRAMRGVNQAFGYFEMSHTVESEPWGYESSAKFLNVGMMFYTELTPLEVLDKLQEIEQSISPDSHRDSNGNYIDRLIDIDIVAIDEQVIDEERLKVPHPHLAERRFFLEPMNEIGPDWRHPVTGKNAAEMLADLNNKQ
ncbi:MAG: 2-amino-4-hydroxy-6-hydroxymethyldihydropteridine diphosphokinase [Muribaculaceae bacterium]|nr:2-amino-4-hydroxy-6-hydroxymethyldihydropteridine diphosphokinase [Muribaculaceae bacterium]